MGQQQAQAIWHVPGEEGIWVLVLGDMTVFAVLFATYLYYRGHSLASYLQSQATLDRFCGVVNTLLLLSSSWFVARGVQLVRQGRQHGAAGQFQLALTCGFGFALVKGFEYVDKFKDGISPVSNEFFAFYFVLTGLHLLHVLIGLIVLTVIIRKCRRVAAEPGVRFVESGATYWHMVDVLWVLLFPLLYLLR